MTREATPPPIPAQGSRKRTLSTKAKEATDGHVNKKGKTREKPQIPNWNPPTALLPKKSTKENVTVNSDDDQTPEPANTNLSHETLEIEDSNSEGDDMGSAIETPEEQRSKTRASAQLFCYQKYVLTFSIIERLSKAWTSPIYTFFSPLPRIETIDGRHVHVFECAALHCKGKAGRGVRRFLDTGDSKSTGGLHMHAKRCWGTETVAAALKTKNLRAAREIVEKAPQRDSSLTAAFERIGKDKITFSHRQHTYEETR